MPNRHDFTLATLFLLAFLLGQLGSAGDLVAQQKVLMAGATATDITPPLGEMIVGGWEPIPAKQIHDRLHARCLALSDGQTRLALVLCDNVGIPMEVFDAAKQQIGDATGIPRSHLLMASTHTHSATTARGKDRLRADDEWTTYQSFLARQISDGVQRAFKQLEPSEIAWGKVDEPSEVFNRRWYATNPSLLANPFGGIDQVRMNPPRGHASLGRPAGPTDPQVSFLSVRRTDGRPIALLANYSLHYVGGVPSGDVSADYFGYFAKQMESKLNVGDQSPAFVAMLSNGTSGDVNNIDFADPKPRKYQPYEKMQEVAGKVSTRVLAELENLRYRREVPLAAAETKLRLQVRRPTPEMLTHLGLTEDDQTQPDQATRSAHRREAIYAKRIKSILDGPKHLDVPLQAFKIGELGIAAIPFEVFTEIGLEIKDRSPLKQTFTIELANGSFGYLPTPRQHRLGGYETWLGTNYVETQASDKIVVEILNLFESLTE